MERANVNFSCACANGETLIVQVFGGYRPDNILAVHFFWGGEEQLSSWVACFISLPATTEGGFWGKWIRVYYWTHENFSLQLYLCLYPVTFLGWQAGVFANKELLFLGMREAFGPSARGNSFGLNSKHFQFTFYSTQLHTSTGKANFHSHTKQLLQVHELNRACIVPPNLESLGQSAATIVGRIQAPEIWPTSSTNFWS